KILEKKVIKSKQIEELLGDRFQNILDTMEDEYFELDLSGTVLFCNSAMLRNSGYSRDKLVGMNYKEFTTEESAKKVYTFFNKVFNTGKPATEIELEVTKKDRSPRILEMSISLLKNTAGKAIGFRGLSRDVTERKKTVDALRESERKYRNILETMEEGYFEVDLAGNFTFVNGSVCKILGFTHDELIDMNNRTFSTPEESKKIYKIYNEIYRTGVSAKIVDHIICKKDRSTINTEISVSLIKNKEGTPVGFCGIARDVTERKQTEGALKKSEEKYRTILETMEEGYYEVDLSGNYTFVNEAACKILGYGRNEMIGMNNIEYSAPEEAKRMYKIFKEIYGTGIPARVVDYKVTTKNKSTKTLETSASLIRGKDGKPIGYRGIVRDITERKQAEAALRKSEEKYRTILETMEEGYYEVDLSGKFTFFNEAELLIHGRTREELMGKNNREFSSVETSKRVYKIFNEVYQTGVPARVIDYEITTKNGSTVTLETSASLIRDEKGKPIGFRGISRNITAKKKS
ncbi:MAG: PAS domain-containing protein, partial [Desulfobacterales bacterium]|nr:PAS domain-containing protein [Desulfobacterales bacterium]